MIPIQYALRRRMMMAKSKPKTFTVTLTGKHTTNERANNAIRYNGAIYTKGSFIVGANEVIGVDYSTTERGRPTGGGLVTVDGAVKVPAGGIKYGTYNYTVTSDITIRGEYHLSYDDFDFGANYITTL